MQITGRLQLLHMGQVSTIFCALPGRMQITGRLQLLHMGQVSAIFSALLGRMQITGGIATSSHGSSEYYIQGTVRQNADHWEIATTSLG
jgi:hypothetical protein